MAPEAAILVEGQLGAGLSTWSTTSAVQLRDNEVRLKAPSGRVAFETGASQDSQGVCFSSDAAQTACDFALVAN